MLFVVLGSLMLLTDSAGFLSTDVGGKVATLEAMKVSGGLTPDLGYWAETADPDGSLYPMWSTSHIEGKWVNATSLPMIYVAYPLYRAGGATLAGLVPVLGTVAAALAAAALARRLGGNGRFAFWVVGLASPATIYALDLWEHSWGLALMLAGVTAALGASDGRDGWRDAALAGLMFGIAATLRQEALVYGSVAGLVLGVRLLVNGRVLAAIGRGLAMAAAAAAMLGANAVLEIAAMGGTLRGGRATGTAGAAGGALRTRIEEAVITAASPFARVDAATIALSLALVGLLVALGLRADRPPHERRVLAAGLLLVAAVMAVDLVAGGLGFIPGLAATTPVAVLGTTRCWRSGDNRFVAAIALGSLPLVWAVQYTGGAGPQWGGRYIITTGALLIVLAAVTFTTESAAAVLRKVAIGAAVVTCVGVVWTIHRTHELADAFRELAARDEPALVFHDPFLAREGGTTVVSERYLAATGPEDRAEAVAALEQMGIDGAGFVDLDDGAAIRRLPGWELVGTDRVELIDGIDLRVTTWQAPGAGSGP